MDKKENVHCEFYVKNWSIKDNVYACEITNKIISENAELEIIGEHLNGKTNQDVEAVNFRDCSLSKVPQGLMQIYPNLKFLQIYRSGLKSIEKNDLKEYKNLQDISIMGNEIQSLPGDLFAGMNDLIEISFNDNQIEVIESNLLDGLDKLKIVDFSRNLCIDMCFNSIGADGNATLEEIKEEIQEICLNPFKTFLDVKNDLKQVIEEIKSSIGTGSDGISEDMKKIIEDENLKDFTVKINEAEFKVHKCLLIARSPALKEMIEAKTDENSLNLVEISKEIFTEILNFIYTDELPKSNDINYFHLFNAADRLQIESLKIFAAEKLVHQMTEENTMEVLTLVKQYEFEMMQQKSIENIKNQLDEFADELTSDLNEQLAKLNVILRMRDEEEKVMKEMKMKSKKK